MRQIRQGLQHRPPGQSSFLLQWHQPQARYLGRDRVQRPIRFFASVPYWAATARQRAMRNSTTASIGKACPSGGGICARMSDAPVKISAGDQCASQQGSGPQPVALASGGGESIHRGLRHAAQASSGRPAAKLKRANPASTSGCAKEIWRSRSRASSKLYAAAAVSGCSNWAISQPHQRGSQRPRFTSSAAKYEPLRRTWRSIPETCLRAPADAPAPPHSNRCSPARWSGAHPPKPLLPKPRASAIRPLPTPTPRQCPRTPDIFSAALGSPVPTARLAIVLLGGLQVSLPSLGSRPAQSERSALQADCRSHLRFPEPRHANGRAAAGEPVAARASASMR